jgi:hypothetical protein
MESQTTWPSLVRWVLKQLKFNQNLGSPRPNVGEGLGVRGTTTAFGCLPLHIQPTSLAFTQDRHGVNPLTPSPSPTLGRGSRPQVLCSQAGKSVASSRGCVKSFLSVCGCFFAASPAVLAQVKKPDKPTGQPASAKPQTTADRQQQVPKVFAIKHADVRR